uniref:Putative secreted protein n=1 Tax=Anopheles triannulatus TaxID=58253 RepID=A0A2M4B3E8_9DIPT
MRLILIVAVPAHVELVAARCHELGPSLVVRTSDALLVLLRAGGGRHGSSSTQPALTSRWDRFLAVHRVSSSPSSSSSLAKEDGSGGWAGGCAETAVEFTKTNRTINIEPHTLHTGGRID